MLDVTRRLSQNHARKLISSILGSGIVTPSRHAMNEQATDKHGAFAMTDVMNVLQHGRIFEPGEMENGTWRYRVHTERFCVVVAFRSESELVVVTNWRKRP